MGPALTGGLGGNERHSASPRGTWRRNNIYIYIYSLQITLFLDDILELICLHTIKWFQVFLSNTNNSIYQVLQCNKNNLHRTVWYQISFNNP